MIRAVDSAYPPSAASLTSARAAGVKMWCGYFSGPNILHGWSRADFQRVTDAGLSTLAYCSGWADPAAMKAQAQVWGVPICLDVEGGIRGNGAWVQGWLNESGAGLYGNAPAFSGHRAAFYILAAYLGFDPQRTWNGAPPGHPCGWQWQGSHSAFGSTIDSAWFDDDIANLRFSGGSGSLGGDEMTDAQFYRLLSAVYGVMLGADGTVQRDAKGDPIPTPATKMQLDAIAKIPGASAPDLHALAAAVAAELSQRLQN